MSVISKIFFKLPFITINKKYKLTAKTNDNGDIVK